jgi:plasmid rolling circle replication initiator protein Rep
MPDETGSNDLYLTDVSPHDKPWDVHRALAMEIESLYGQTIHSQYAERIKECSKSLGFGLEAQEDGTFKLKLDTARFCRVRHCAVCQWRRMLMWRARFFKAIPKILQEHPSARWIFLTLTVQNCPLSELRATITHMNRAWQRLSKRKQFPAHGWIRSVEVTRAKDDLAHPHFHCLLMVPPSYFGKSYIKHEEWTQLWKDALRADYTPIVHVRTIKDRRGKGQDSSDSLAEGMIAAILETIKYTVKPEDLAGSTDPSQQMSNAQWLEELTTQLHKTRAIAVGGVLKQFISEDEPEDLIHTEDDEISMTEEGIKLFFGWREMVKRYAKEDK